jgi:endonuclease G
MKLAIASILLTASLSAVSGNCDKFYPGGKEFIVPSTVELCNSFYVTRFDNTHNRNVMSIDLVKASRPRVQREDNFRADSRVTRPANPSDYTRSGYDKGHMVPAADANTPQDMSDTFLLTNMTPQVPSLNRGAWRELEESIRNNAWTTRRDTYVITGALYKSIITATIGKNKVPVPTGYYKIVYLPLGVKAYYADNTPTGTVKPVPVSEIENKSGLVFPKL